MKNTHSYPNGLLKEIRKKAKEADPSVLSKLKNKLSEQKNMQKFENPFKKLSDDELVEVLKINTAD